MACGRNAFIFFALLAIATVKAEEGSGSEPPKDQTGDEHQDRYSFNVPFFSSNMGTGNGELPSLSQLFGSGSNGTGNGNPFASFLAAFSQFLPNNNSSSSRLNMGTENGQLPNLSQLFGGGLNSTGNPFAAFLAAISQFLPNNNSSSNSRQEQVQYDDAQQDQGQQNKLFFGSLFGVPATCNYTKTPGLSCAGCRERLTCNPGNTGRIRVCSHIFAPYCNNGRCSSYPGPACFSTSSAPTTPGTTTT